MVVGAQVDGSIASAGQRQFYTFSLAADSRLLFDSLTNSSQLNWTLAGPLGTVIAGATSAQRLGQPCGADAAQPGGGDYTLSVDASADSTALQLPPLDLPCRAPSRWTPMSRHLVAANSTALYKFDASAGDAVLFDRKALSGGSPYWRLVDPTGVQLFGPEFFNDRAAITLAMTGSYTVFFEGLVGDITATNYTFNLTLQGNTPPPALTGTEITLGNTVNGVISAVGEADDYVFTIAAPTRIVFDGLSTNPNFTWRIDGPRGLEVSRPIYADAADWGATAAIELVVPGTYRLRMTGNGSTTGNYGFRLFDLASASAITPGTAVSGTLNPANSTQLYKFDVVPGERFFFDRTANSGGDTYWRLLDPYGRPVWGPGGIGGDMKAYAP